MSFIQTLYELQASNCQPLNHLYHILVIFFLKNILLFQELFLEKHTTFSRLLSCYSCNLSLYYKMKTPSYEEEYLSNFDESLYEQEHLVAFGIIGDNVFKDIIVTEEKHDSATGIASVSITFKGAKDFKVDPTSTYINLFTKNGIVIMLDMISYNTSTQTVPLFSMGSPLPAYTSNGKTDCSLRCNVLGRRKIKPEDMTAIVIAGL